MLQAAKHRFAQNGDSPDAAWEAFGKPRANGDPSDKSIVRDELSQIQEGLCAYCEGSLQSGAHIDHFRRKGRHREVTFEWTNLLLSCVSQEHCGFPKDRQHYSESDLIHPGQEDPELLLVFSARDASLQPRNGLSDPERIRATETIRVLGLNDPGLREDRHRIAEDHLKILRSLISGGCSKADIEPMINEAQYRTCLRHIVLGTP